MARLTLIRRDIPMKDGRYRVYVRLSHKGRVVKKSTDFFCTENDTDEGCVVTSPKLIVKIYASFLQEWEDRLERLTETTDTGSMSAEDIFDHVAQSSGRMPDIRKIDFLAFGWRHYDKCVADGRKSSANNFMAVLNAIRDYSGSDTVTVSELTTVFVNGFTEYLLKPHKNTRKNHGRMVTTRRPALKHKSVNNYIRDFKTMFNAMRREYSDPLTGEDYIRTNPFRFWKPLMVPNSDGFRAIGADEVRLICGTKDEGLLPCEMMGRDMFMLSFCLIGINATDLYDLMFHDYKNGRIGYNRNKTKGVRSDNAFISVEVPPIVIPLIDRYAGKHRLLNLSDTYSTVSNMSKTVNRGLRTLCARLGIPSVTYYSARHSWATIARNDCGVSREDVDFALNHISGDLKMADKYVAKDFSINDRNNRKVVGFVFGNPAPSQGLCQPECPISVPKVEN